MTKFSMHGLPGTSLSGDGVHTTRPAPGLSRSGGGAQMDPVTPAFRRILRNPAAYCAFKATEPWLLEYIGLDMAAAAEAAGFGPPRQGAVSPRHKAVVAIKPR